MKYLNHDSQVDKSITIAIPTIGRKSLRTTIESIINQTFPNWTILVSDNSNSQSVKDLCLSFNDDRISYVGHEYNLGPVGNPNYCLKQCNGDFLVVMHDDDYFLPDYLQNMLDLFGKYPTAMWGFCNARLEYEGGLSSSKILNATNDEFMRSGSEFCKAIISEKVKILMPLVMYRNEICKYISFDENLISMCDLKMWLDLSLTYDAVYAKKPIFCYRIWNSNGSISRAHEGQFFRDALTILKWLEESVNFSLKSHEFNKIKRKVILSHCAIIIWMQYKHPHPDIKCMIDALNMRPSILTSATKFIISNVFLLRIVGYLGSLLRAYRMRK